MESNTVSEYVYDWSDYFYASNTLLATITNLDSFHGRMQLMLRQWICGYNEVGAQLSGSVLLQGASPTAPSRFRRSGLSSSSVPG